VTELLQTSLWTGPTLGWLAASSGFNTFNMNSANQWVGMGFYNVAAKTLNSVRFYINSAVGSLAASDVSVELYTDSASGTPGSQIEAKTLSAAPSGAGWYTASGFTTSLSANTPYHIVLKNLNASPASNYYTIRTPAVGVIFQHFVQVFAGQNRDLWSYRTSTNGGSSWSSAIRSCHMRLGFSDGTYAGFPCNVLDSNASNGNARVYGSREVGVKFTPPWSGYIDGVAIPFGLTSGSPTGNAWARIRINNGAYVQSSNAMPPSITGSFYRMFMWSSPQLIKTSDTVYITLFDDQADGSLNSYGMNVFYFDNDAASTPLMPFNGTLRAIYTTDNGAPTITWNEFSMSGHVSAMPILLLFDPDNPVVSSGGGLFVRRGMRGGFNQ
jgi:hypothetical protein